MSTTPPIASNASLYVYGGTTIRLTMSWVDWTGAAVDPDADTQTLTIINTDTGTSTDVTADIEKDSVGNYHCDYTTPTVTGSTLLCAQWNASISNETDVRRYYFGVYP